MHRFFLFFFLNQCDLPEVSVDREYLTRFAQENGFVGWMETSARTNQNIGLCSFSSLTHPPLLRNSPSPLPFFSFYFYFFYFYSYFPICLPLTHSIHKQSLHTSTTTSSSSSFSSPQTKPCVSLWALSWNSPVQPSLHNPMLRTTTMEVVRVCDPLMRMKRGFILHSALLPPLASTSPKTTATRMLLALANALAKLLFIHFLFSHSHSHFAFIPLFLVNIFAYFLRVSDLKVLS